MVKIINGNKEYKGKCKTTALKNINIAFDDAGLTVIYGVSGSGKTTLLNCIAGLDELTSGEIAGCEKEDVGFIFQDFALMDNLSIYENLKIAYDMSNKEISIEQALFNVIINEPLDKKVNELSGGQKQRIAIARAILINSKIIIADEPTGNLDKDNSINIAKILKEISKEKLVIVVTHDKTLFEDYADRIIMLEDGEVVSDDIKSTDKAELSSSKDNDRNLNLNLKTAFKIYFGGAKQSVSKLIMGIFILFLAMFSIMLMLNTLTESKNKMLLNAADEYNINVLNFYKKNESVYEALSDDDVEKINKACKDYNFSYTGDYNCIIDGNEVIINRIYETSIVQEDMLYGKKELEYSGVVISYSLAEDIQGFYGLSKIEDVIGINITINNSNLLVSGVAEKIKPLVRREGYDYFESLFEKEKKYVHMDSKTLEAVLYNGMNSYSRFSTKHRLTSYIYNLDELTSLEISTGTASLNDNEIIIKESNIVDFFGSSISKDDLLNNEYSFEFLCDGKNLGSYKLKVVGFGNYTAVNSNTFRDLYEYSTDYYNMIRNFGVAISRNNLSVSILDKLEKSDIVTNFYLYENVESSYLMVNFIGLSMLIVIIPTILIVLLYLISYSKQNIVIKRREIGILKSLGLPNKQISKIFIFDSIFLLLISSALTLILTPIGVSLLNDILASAGSMFNSIKYEPIFLFGLALVLILIFIASLFINLLKLNKKADVDLVYGR